MEKIDLVHLLLQLIEPQQSRSLQFNDLLALVALVDLLGILNVMQPQASQGTGSRPLQEALQAVLQGQATKTGTGDLLGLLTKNPSALKNLFSLLNKEEQELEIKGEDGAGKTAGDESLKIKNKRA